MIKHVYKGIEFEIRSNIKGCLKFYTVHELNDKNSFNNNPQFAYISDALEWKKNLIDKINDNNFRPLDTSI